MTEPKLAQVEAWAKHAGRLLAEMQSEDLQIVHKGEADLVTRADKASEAYLIQLIREAFPSHSIVAEESGSHPGDPNHQWFIDPLDGTLNYAHGLPIYCVSIAYAFNGLLKLGAIYAPAMDEFFSAEAGKGTYFNGRPAQVSGTSRLIDAMMVTGFRRYLLDTPRSNIDNFFRVNAACQSVRRLGSASLDLAYVAAGRLDGFWEMDIHSWDIAAGILLVQEAGGTVEALQPEGGLLALSVDLIASNPRLFPDFKALIHYKQ